MIKDRLLDIMERSLECYSKERIENYIKSTQENGLTEHGFPRLGVNLGFLIIDGRKQEFKDYFYKIMDICCREIPKVKAANEFSIREIALLIIMADRLNAIEREKLLEWKKKLSSPSPFDLYKKVYTLGGRLNNWAVFAGLSEWMRVYLGIKGDRDFTEKQLETQKEWFDENGFYLEPHNPMVYDVVTRHLFCELLTFDYNGEYKDFLDEKLKNAALASLKTLSVNNEMPFGGRSNQFIYNEAVYIPIFMHEADRYRKENNYYLAGVFKRATMLMIKRVEENLAFYKGRHVKNFYDSDSKIGCESYAYFDKYMITTASYLQLAFFYDIDSIEEVKTINEREAFIYKTSDEFHKVFLSNKTYSVEVELNADGSYDANGIGRIHKKGAPDSLCLSTPFSKEPNYKIEMPNETAFSICPVVEKNGELILGAEKSTIKLIKSKIKGDKVIAKFLYTLKNKQKVFFSISVDNDGVEVCTKSLFNKVGVAFPVFSFDGERETVIESNEDKVNIKYLDYTLTYQGENLKYMGKDFCNRNGKSKGYYALSKNSAKLKISIEK